MSGLREMTAHALPLYSVLPFVAMLLAIGFMPLLAARWWESLRRKAILTGLIALPVLVFLILWSPAHLAHTIREYSSFICLLGSLYVISGGILLTGDIRATPRVNATFLLCGAVLANLIGTTGASMLLIRPLLRTNQERRRIHHLPVFFIFLVSNIGGCLTPLGDPPLFLGYLRGVPFTWTLGLWPEWLFATGILIGLFYLIDSVQYRREARVDRIVDKLEVEPLRVAGSGNLAGLLGVLILVLWVPTPWREIGMIVLAALSHSLTPRAIHKENRFGFYPIQEVAILFVGIFITMVPALLLLEARGDEMGIAAPWQFFWVTGGLSSFLDNAPTYLSVSSLALGLRQLPGEGTAPLAALVSDPAGAAILRAISVGAVFMGANTYIGNGPNFMVKSICDRQGVKTPSFFGYMLWSIAILIPLFLAVTLIFFRS
jgi:Na+/H+ antiporter NhaD/arsenite permease-like protein